MLLPVSSSRRSVLIVEDDAAIRRAVSEALRDEHFETSTCENGREALDYLRREPHPDVIVLDLMMPVMDGWEFRVEQRQDPRIAAIPVVALSADRTPKAVAIDADAYLKKPVDLTTLVNTVSRVVLTCENRLLQTRLAQADRLIALGTLAAGVAHEINNPLAYVTLNLSFLGEKLPLLLAEGSASKKGEWEADLGKKLLKALHATRIGTDRIRTVVHGLKMFSGPEHPASGPVDVRTVLDSVVPMIMHELEHRARLEKDYGNVPYIVANEAQLAQVFLNLLLNAAQSLSDGPANEIRVRVRHAPPHIVVEVHDTGSGIPEDVRPRIFEPFFTTKPVGVGTGLGLPICHGIVRALRGELTFETEVGRGSVFRLTLPTWTGGDVLPEPASRRTWRTGGDKPRA
jgi:signal transduction histidine kinase